MQHSDTEQILSRLGRIMRRRKLLLATCFVVVLGPIGIYNEVETPIYEADTTVVFDEVSAPVESYEYDLSRDIVTANRLEEFTSYSFAKDIADALGRRGIVIDRHKIDLEEPLKMLGTYKVAIKVFPGLTPEVTIAVEPKG